MTDAEQSSYRAAYETARKMVPRGHTIQHVEWRDGHLTATAGPKPRDHGLEFEPRGRRGILQERLI